MEQLVEKLLQSSVLKTPRIVAAFRTIDRKDFVREEYEDEAYENMPLPIGSGQTISQPYTVAFMLELLAPKLGNTVMDVGSGSGWQTALLAHIVGATGKVYAIERVPELVKFGEKNIAKYNFLTKNVVEMCEQSAETNIPGTVPLDCIIAGASAQKIPPVWKERIRAGGRIVMPIRESIFLFIKNKNGSFEKKEYPDFVFVPFITM